MKKWILAVALLVIVLVVGIGVLWVIFTPKPIPLSPNATIELKLAEKAPADGLTPVVLEHMRGETLYVSDKADLSTSDVAGVYKSRGQIGDTQITVVLTEAGSARVWSLTSLNVDRHIVIFVNGRAISAPVVQAPVRKRFVIDKARAETRDELFRELTEP